MHAHITVYVLVGRCAQHAHVQSTREHAYAYAHTHMYNQPTMLTQCFVKMATSAMMVTVTTDDVDSMLRKNGHECNDGDCEAEQDPAV